MKKTTIGFTIVELLIVIVVIAILATISVVAYTGIQNRANDSAVQQDVSSFVKKIMMYHATESTYPAGGGSVAIEGGSTSGSPSAAPTGMNMSVTRSSYHQPTSGGAANFIYCAGPDLVSGAPSFTMYGVSKSRNAFLFTSAKVLESKGAVAGIYIADACEGLGFPRTFSYGYSVNAGGWQSWTN